MFCFFLSYWQGLLSIDGGSEYGDVVCIAKISQYINAKPDANVTSAGLSAHKVDNVAAGEIKGPFLLTQNK